MEDRLLTQEELKEALSERCNLGFDTKRLRWDCIYPADFMGIAKAQDAKTLKAIGEDYYCVPKWCKMPPLDHFDGMEGCWGISHALEEGESYCSGCEYHKIRHFRHCENSRPGLP